MKFCFKCGEEKDLSAFYKHKRMADGHLNKCKECTKKDSTAHRNANIEKVRAYDRERGSRQTPEYQRRYRRANKAKTRAHRMIQYHIMRGNLTPKPCERCGSTVKIHAHHEDYSKPLDVMWLCPLHHKERHKEI